MHKDSTAIILITIILTVLGIMVSYSVEGIEKTLQSFLVKQLILLFLGGGMFIFMFFSDYHSLFKPNALWVLSLVSVICLVLVLIIGDVFNGARRWLSLPGGFSIQPSEFAKFIVLINMTWYFCRFYDRLKSFTFGIVFPLLLSGFYVGLIFLENDQGIPMVIMATVLCMMFVAGIQKKYLVFGSGLLGILFGFAILLKPHRIYRIIYTWFPEWDPSGKGWHIIQSLVGFYKGGIMGVGIGAGEQKLGYLPAPHRDFPFSLIAEELGFLGALLIVLLFALFVYYGFKIARKAPDLQGSLLAMGITCMIGIQAVVMMLVNMGLLPVKGMCLPLVSSGGSSFVASMMMLGCLINIGIQEVQTEPYTYGKVSILLSPKNLLN
ncbi:MAG TPA: putative peptidoglycan glycosyltransferase FtsW [Candidatus Hydrogenedens sp.]|nr:putative peptidoglycan glycosyltransferase FtsW [Candidatus Hydrogenedens sp.]